MTLKKSPAEKYRMVQVTYRPDQEEKVRALQKGRNLSKIFQEALDAIRI
jgi:hypothetical protein